MLSAPSLHILEAKCYFPISPPSLYYPTEPFRCYKVGRDTAALVWFYGCRAVSGRINDTRHSASLLLGSPRLDGCPGCSSLSGRCIRISSCQVFLFKQLGVWAAACSLKASEIFVAALLVLILLEQK